MSLLILTRTQSTDLRTGQALFMSIFKLYVLKSLRDSKRYIGYTSNLERRLLEHNKGMVKSTKKRKPFIVIYTESYDTRLAVIKREYYFKSRAGRRFMDDKGIK